MKVAIVHDYIKEYGGAERVLEELLKLYPKADVYTALYVPRFLGPHRARFEKYKIHQSFFRFIPFAHKLISPLRIISPLAFSSFNLSSYDVVIVSQTGAYFPNMIRTDGGAHICYTHTPPRYLYGYMTARAWKKNVIVRSCAEFVNHFLRMVDYYSSRRVDVFVANSEEVKMRIEKFYRRQAVVVYPPVTDAVMDKVQVSQEKKRYFLAGGRLARAKGMDIIVDAFLENGKTLKIFGKGFAGFEEELLAKLHGGSTNIEFVGEVSDSEKLGLMRGASAYVFASFDEDFGITPVEAMGQGTPVVAYESGGVQETVVEGVTGVFYSPNNSRELNLAIKRVEVLRKTQAEKLRKACVAQAAKFRGEVFDEKIKKVVSDSLL